MFDGDRWNLVNSKGMYFFSIESTKANVPYLSYEYPPESIRNGSIDTNEVELDRPLRQSVDLDM